MKRISLMLLLLLAAANASFGGAITPDTWYQFDWNSGNGYNGVGPPWTISNVSTVYLVLVDGYKSGDRFEAFDNASSLGQTSIVPTGITDCAGGNSGANCLVDPNFSLGIFALAPGNHSLEIVITANPYGSGTGFFNVMSQDPSAIPEPSTYALMGLGVLALARHRRRNR